MIGDGLTLRAAVVGSGPNGLAASITLARAGAAVTVFESSGTIGGGLRSGEATLSGLIHDHCAAIVPTAVASPFLRSLALEDYGVEWAWPQVELAHPIDDGRAGILMRSFSDMDNAIGEDSARWRALFEWPSEAFETLSQDLLSPILHVPHHPFGVARFGAPSLLPATILARTFKTPEAKALFAGNAAHAWTPLSRVPSGAIGLLFGAVAHRYGWPCVKGGSQRLADALAAIATSLGTRIELEAQISSLSPLAEFDLVLFDTSPRLVLELLGDQIPNRIRKAYSSFRYGSAAFKLDIAVYDGVPWRNPSIRDAGTVHVCGSYHEVVEAERLTFRGQMPKRPFMILGQQSVADPTRSAGNLHPIYLYAHVPHGYAGDATETMLNQVERFAPGFRDRIHTVASVSPGDLERNNANLVGGDVNGGAMNFRQFFARPRLSRDPYWTGVDGYYLCSSSTPPGGGVHGMCGHLAAVAALLRVHQR